MELDEFIEDEDGSGDTTLHIMQVEYTEQFGDPIIHLWGRTQSGERHHVEVEGFRPSFYIHKEAFGRRIANHDWVEDYSAGHRSIQGESLVKVEPRLPKHVGGGRDIDKGLRDYFDQTWEGDVFFTSQFLIDTGIETHATFDSDDTWKSQYHDGDYRIDVSDLNAVEEPDWRADPRMVTVDIEVLSPDGFPEAADAEHPVTAITAYDNYDETYTVWVLRYEGWTYSDTEVQNIAIDNRPSTIEIGGERLPANIEDVRVFENEGQMLHDFNNYVADRRPDLLSGWNSSSSDGTDSFDYPYLYNRSKNLHVSNHRDWSPLEQVWTTRRGRGQNLTMGGKGVGFFDMMQAYKKTQWQEPDGGWGLENISGKELPDDATKGDIEDIDTAWRSNLGEFLKYNIRDVQAVVGIDKGAGVTDLFQNIRALAGVQFENCHNNIDLLDVLILRYADDMDLVLPTNEEPDRGWYYGAHVFEPQLGRHENVVYPDLWSMYPNMIRNVNMSPETLIGTAEDLEASEYTEEDCRWTYIDTRPTSVKNPDSMDGAADPRYEKVYFLKPSVKTGFMTEVVDDLMGMKDYYDGTALYAAVKRIVNSVYGVYGDSDSYGKGYRLFDWRIAEGITLGGRKMIQDSSEQFVDALNDIKEECGFDGNNAYRVGGDTDSVMTAIPFMDVDYSQSESSAGSQSADSDEVDYSQSDTIHILDGGGNTVEVPAYYTDFADIVEVAHEAADRVNDWYSEWTADTLGLTEGDHYCELEIESFAPRAFIPEGVTKKKAKKRYAEIIAWDEGDWENPPEFSVTGIDIVRSDRAPVTRSILEDVLDTILREDDRETARRAVYDTISEEVEAIRGGSRDYEWYARPKGMNDPAHSYGDPENKAMPTYKGAKYVNEYFGWEQVSPGDKPALLYIDKVIGDYPTAYPDDWHSREAGEAVDAIAMNDPNELPDGFVVDTEKMIEKTVEDPLTPILSPMRWDFDEALSDTEQAGIEAFM